MAEKQIILESDQFFLDLVQEALGSRGLKSHPLTSSYLAEILQHFMATDNLFDETTSSGKKSRSTLAEMYLKALNNDSNIRLDLLKKVGDTSLYVSGFFAESLNRKIIDVDYYVNMGESAFDSLARNVGEDLYSQVYEEFALRFVDFMDLLSYISKKTNLHTNHNLLKLYENYQKTGSNLAKETLIEHGFIVEEDDKKPIAQ